MIMDNNGKMNLFGGLDSWSMADSTPLSEQMKQDAARRHNEVIEKEAKLRQDALNAKIKDEIQKAKEITEKVESMEIMPMGSYVLVRPYAKNPYEKIEVRDSGLVIPEFDGTFKNPDSGEEDRMDNFSCQGTVIEVGPLVKWLKEGDDIFYRRAQAVPVPFFKQGFEVVPEQCIQCVINEGVKDRWNAIKSAE